MVDIALTVLSLLGFLLSTATLKCLSRAADRDSRPLATYTLITWLLVVNLFSVVDSLIWRGDDPSTWWDGRVYCHVVSKIKLEWRIGVCGSAIGISRYLTEIMDPKLNHTAHHRDNRAKRNLIDASVGIGLPVLNVVFHFIVEPSRYGIMGVYGCKSGTRMVWPAFPLYFLWVPVLSLIACIYCSKPG